MEELQTLFLRPESLERLLLYMCKTNITSPDPITESTRAMLSNPVQFSVSRCGLGILKGQPVFPFCYMSVDQRDYVHSLTRAISRGDDMHSAFQTLEDPLTYLVENERIIFRGQTNALDQKLVFDVLLGCMAKANQKGRIQLLTDLLLQRIAGKVQLSRDTLKHIESRMQAHQI